MYIAMNRFKVARGSEDAFEDVWRNRDSQLKDVPGFVEFRLLKGPAEEAFTLFASHTTWASHDDFVNWTKSEHFRKAHRNAGDNSALYLDHPRFEGFEVVLGE